MLFVCNDYIWIYSLSLSLSPERLSHVSQFVHIDEDDHEKTLAGLSPSFRVFVGPFI